MRLGAPRVLLDAAGQWHPGPRLIGGLISVTLHLTLLIALACYGLPARGPTEVAFLVGEQAAGPERTSVPLVQTPGWSLDAVEPAEGLLTLPSAEIPLVTDLGAPMELVGAVRLASGATATPLPEDWKSPGAEAGAPAGTVGEAELAGRPVGDGQPTGSEAEFFGLRASGDAFIYMLDMSTSMAELSPSGQTRFQLAAAELLRSIDALYDSQRFFVILFAYRTHFLFDLRESSVQLYPATAENKARLRRWLTEARLEPGTDPRLGLSVALRMQPSAIFLLTDGAFNQRSDQSRAWLMRGNPTVETIVGKSGVSIPIHTVAFEDPWNRKRLRHLSKWTGGTHRFASSLGSGQLLLADLGSRDPDDVLDALDAIIARPNDLTPWDKRRIAELLMHLPATAPQAWRQRAVQALQAIGGLAAAPPDRAAEAENPPPQEITPAKTSTPREPDTSPPFQASRSPHPAHAATSRRQ